MIELLKEIIKLLKKLINRVYKRSSRSTVTKRSRVALVLIFLLMLVVCARFVQLQIIDPEGYRTRALDQYTSSVTISAKRGTIYANDATTELAFSATVYNCFISPYDIEELIKNNAENDTSDTRTYEEVLTTVANGLSEILSVDKDEIITKGNKKSSRYQMIKKFLNENEEAEIRNFISENKFQNIVNLEETNKRFYRYGSFASHLIGFTGVDNQGRAGIEAAYDEYLAGVDGKSVKAADGYGNELDSGVGSTYIPATNGLNVWILTFITRVCSLSIFQVCQIFKLRRIRRTLSLNLFRRLIQLRTEQ